MCVCVWGGATVCPEAEDGSLVVICRPSRWQPGLGERRAQAGRVAQRKYCLWWWEECPVSDPGPTGGFLGVVSPVLTGHRVGFQRPKMEKESRLS